MSIVVPPLNQFFHVRRNWGGEIQVSAGDRVGQGQRVGVESGAGDQVRVLRAVEPVAGERAADGGHVHQSNSFKVFINDSATYCPPNAP